MAKEVKKKVKVSATKVIGEAIQFVACPPYKIGKWISDAADKKAVQKEAATVDDKKNERDAKVEKAEELAKEGKSLDKVAEEVKVEEVEVKEVQKDEPQT